MTPERRRHDSLLFDRKIDSTLRPPFFLFLFPSFLLFLLSIRCCNNSFRAADEEGATHQSERRSHKNEGTKDKGAGA